MHVLTLLQSVPTVTTHELFEFDETPTLPREERLPVQLESRGVTSHPRRRAETSQQEFWENLSMFSESIVAKLDGAQRTDIADLIRDCHSVATYKRCVGCSALSKFYNRCDRLWCPLCTPRLARERRDAVEWWVREIKSPKHVVLTVRNTTTITKDYVLWFKAAFARLRRLKFARNWIGGFYSLEVTNEGRGWHLHLHALVDSRFIDERELAVQWAKCVGQDFAIVKVKYRQDTGAESYLKEVTKYAVKGSQLAAWSGSDIALFVDAFSGVRTFGVFGSLYGKRTEFREWIDQLQRQAHACECGCTDFHLLSENEMLEADLMPALKSPRANGPPSKQNLLSLSIPNFNHYKAGL